MLDELIETEKSLWANDPEFYEATYLPDAVLIFAETGRIGRDVAVAAILEENRRGRHWADVRFEGASTMPIASDVVLLNYTAHARWNHETAPSSALCATVYVKRAGSWRVASHQQTIAVSHDP
ncbi:nuclear transport factor 2 family protein [Ensifer sp. IC4062]|nr:nuclear transport factor 2 family protein [Ensifer sp. IC4062]MCA1440384.1 nuclear transport factor 2 family protein [Ensifer sp. IC4062]